MLKLGAAHGRAFASRWVAAVALILAAAAVPLAPAAAFDAKTAEKSVVRVFIHFDRDGKTYFGGHGSGFVIDRDYVATNWHVAESAQLKKANLPYRLYVINPSLKDAILAEIVWTSQELDIAVLRVRNLGLPVLELSSRDAFDYPGKGDPVFTMGYPGISDRTFGQQATQEQDAILRQATVTRGVVGRVLNIAHGGRAHPMIQHDASINPGNSGGPLFDNCNRVLGINTFGSTTNLTISKDDKGNPIAAQGSVASGSFFSPHIGHLIQSVRTVDKIKDVRLSLSSEVCTASDGASPVLIVFSGLALVVAMGAVGLVMFRRREVVRVVESYSAWVGRKGLEPGAKRTDSAPVAKPRPPSSRSPVARRPAASEATAVPSAARNEATAVPAASGDWVLKGTDGSQQRVSLAISPADLDKAASLAEKGIVIGRSASMADKVLNDSSISRRHAKLARHGDTLTIEDLKSAYGTKVNGQSLEPFQPTTLSPGDAVELGAVTLEVSRK